MAPSPSPTRYPTSLPSPLPSISPTESPTHVPTSTPAPSAEPTSQPTTSFAPTAEPSDCDEIYFESTPTDAKSINGGLHWNATLHADFGTQHHVAVGIKSGRVMNQVGFYNHVRENISMATSVLFVRVPTSP